MGGVDHHVRVRHLLVWIEFRIPLSHVIFSLRFYHPQELLGNASNNAVVKQELDPPIVAWFLRIYPEDYHRFRILRLELYGCTSG